VFSKDGGDGHTRELIIEFSETPTRRETDGVVFATPLAPHATFRVALSFTMEERESSAPPNSEGQVREQSEGTEEASERSMEAWMSGFSRVRSTALSMFKSRGTAAEEHAASAENR
jgi:hypothetical protein